MDRHKTDVWDLEDDVLAIEKGNFILTTKRRQTEDGEAFAVSLGGGYSSKGVRDTNSSITIYEAYYSGVLDDPHQRSQIERVKTLIHEIAHSRGSNKYVEREMNNGVDYFDRIGEAHPRATSTAFVQRYLMAN